MHGSDEVRIDGWGIMSIIFGINIYPGKRLGFKVRGNRNRTDLSGNRSYFHVISS
jgi:hypothetical protein